MLKLNLKRGVFLAFLLCCVTAVWAQQRLLKFNIVEFYQDPQATTALSSEYEKIDGSGSRMAIIKVMSADPSVAIENLDAFMFNFGNMKHETVVHGDELWVYVQKNARTVSITRDGYAPIKKYDLRTTIKEGATYVMKITFDKVVQNTVYSLNKQVLQIKVDPATAGALVSITREGEQTPMETTATDATGNATWNLDFGTYFYEVNLPSYLPGQGRIKLTTSDSTHVEQVKLTPNFGYLEIAEATNAGGAKVFVDGREVGTVPYKSTVKWDCGPHELTLVKDLYKSYSQTFTITQGETTVITPQLESNFAETTLEVDGGADIYIDGVRKGTGRWAGPLKAGTYLVECRKTNHRPTQKRITVEVDVASTVTLDPPVPITGYLFVNSNPAGAKITIDGQDYGITPRNISDLLIGRHRVEVSMTNRKTETREVDIQEGKQETVDVKLGSMGNIKFTSHPTYTSLYIDGQYVGITPLEKEMPSGRYDIKATASGYRTYHEKVNIDVAHPNVQFRLARQFMKKGSFYFGVDGQFGSLGAFGGTMGFYAGGVNVEGSCMKGFGKETVYWCASGESDEQMLPYEEEIKLGLCAGGKIGYGIIIGTRFRMTPQLGLNYVSAKGKETSTYALSGTGGLRLEVACIPHLGISVTPEYAFKMKEADGYKRLAAVLPGMKSWTEGFNCKVGVYVFF